MLTRTPYSKGAGSAGPPVVDPSVRAVPSALYTVLPHTNNGTPAARTASRTCTECSGPAWKSKFYGALVLNHRVVLHAIDATPDRWSGDADSSPLDRATHPTHWLISTQLRTGALDNKFDLDAIHRRLQPRPLVEDVLDGRTVLREERRHFGDAAGSVRDLSHKTHQAAVRR